MFGPYVHRIDPILFDIGGVHLWWYGLGYTLGFLQIHAVLRRGRESLGLSRREVLSLTLFIACGVLVGGRAVEVAFDEWPFYRDHPGLVFAFWLGGMATHGLLLGGGSLRRSSPASLEDRFCHSPTPSRSPRRSSWEWGGLATSSTARLLAGTSESARSG